MNNSRHVKGIVAAGLVAICAAFVEPSRVVLAQERPLLEPAVGSGVGSGVGPAVGPGLRFQRPALPAPEDVIMLQLRDGRIRWGAISDHGPETFEFTLLDTGGRVSIPWSLIDPRQTETLRTEFGYVDVEAEEALVDAERLLLQGGGVVEGVIVSREGDSFLVKTDGNLQRVPKVRVRGIESGVRLPALDVYSREELYGLYLAETDTTSADAQLALALRCESILDFVHASTHFEEALELGLTVDVAKVEGMLARALVKAENQEQLEYLRDSDRLRKRKRFDAAQAMLTAFPETFPDSTLLEDARKQEVRLGRARDAEGKKLVRSRWKHWARKLCRERGRDDNFEAARTWAVEQASADITQKVLADVQKRITAAATEEDVRQLWLARDRGRYHSVTYGVATWMLGKDRAQAGGEAESETPAAAVSKVDQERKAVEDRIKRYLDNQRVARRSGSANDDDDASQTYWTSMAALDRGVWLQAYYIEESGDLDVRARPRFRNCKTCAGAGAIQLLVTGAVPKGEQASVALCPTCRGVQIVRTVYFR